MAATPLPKNIGPYQIAKEIGRGAYGVVYEAIAPDGARVAVKCFHLSPAVKDAVNKGLITEDELKKRFNREIRYQSEITHPNVMHIIAQDVNAKPPYFAMELASCSLESELVADRTLGGNPKPALFDILAGLEAIHDLGIVHRDLKPQNILKCATAGNTRYVISDFGLMTATTSNTTSLTMTGVQGGTPYYAAPELITNFKRATSGADIYSFGAILHDIFSGGAGRVPYTELSVPGNLEPIVRRCTKRLPIRRYANIADLRSDLQAILSAGPVTFSSSEEKAIVELLNQQSTLTESQWDDVLTLLDRQQAEGQSVSNVMGAIKLDHISQLASTAPELLAALGNDYCAWIRDREGGFDFDFCDVLGDRLEAFFGAGDVKLKSNALLALLVLGASHNRWAVERKFARLAGTTLDEPVAKRAVADVKILDIKFVALYQHVEWSIKTSRDLLHPMLKALMDNEAKN